jgi:hypothetical protein
VIVFGWELPVGSGLELMNQHTSARRRKRGLSGHQDLQKGGNPSPFKVSMAATRRPETRTPREMLDSEMGYCIIMSCRGSLC